MICVTNHAEPTPTSRMASSHDCIVGSGSLFCQQSKANAAATDTTNCMYCMGKA